MVCEVERACTSLGRDPATLRRTWGGGCICAPTQKAAEILARERNSPDDDPDDFDLIGTPQQLIEQIHPFIELGVDTFMLDCGGFPDLTTLELLVSDVLPELQG